MPAPTLTVPWYTQGEVSFPLTTDLQATQRSWLWLLKAFLKNEVVGGVLNGSRPGGSAWTCEGSCDGVAAGMDAVDRWTSTFTPSKLVRAAEGVAHSWIVLKSPVAMGPVYVLLNYNGASEGQSNITFSRSPYTGGTTTAKPTATNETNVTSTTVAASFGQMSVESIFNVTYRAQFVCNANGEWVFFTNRAGAGRFDTVYACVNAVNQLVGDTWPTLMFGDSSSSGRGAGVGGSIGVASSGHGMRTPSGAARQSTGGMGLFAFGATSHNFAGSMPLDVLQTLWLTLPIYICNTGDTGQQAWRGNLADFYWVGAAPVGSGYPSAASQTQMVVGDMLLPSGVPVAL